MKINVGIVGIGNLGTALIKYLKNNQNFNLVATFSRRNIKNTIPYTNILDYKEKIDLLFLCVGSQNDLEPTANELVKHFNLIESYDNHRQLEKHIKNMHKLAKNNNKVVLCSIGWDPGLFSLIRAIFSSIGFKPHTFWGKGTSQGHTQAIKQINGVVDAVQFTIPNKKSINKIKNGKTPPNKNFHKRICYVNCLKQDRKRIKETIINMPDYFKDYKTKVHFISQQKLNKIKSFSHKGIVLTESNTMNFSLNLKSNPDFTAKVLIAYANSYKTLKEKKMFGAHTIFDIPLSYIIDNKYEFL